MSRKKQSKDDVLPKSVNEDETTDEYSEEDYSDDEEEENDESMPLDQKHSDQIISPNDASITPAIKPKPRRGNRVNDSKTSLKGNSVSLNKDSLIKAGLLNDDTKKPAYVIKPEIGYKYTPPDTSINDKSSKSNKCKKWIKSVDCKYVCVIIILIIGMIGITLYFVLKRRKELHNDIILGSGLKREADEIYEKERAIEEKNKEMANKLKFDKVKFDKKISNTSSNGGGCKKVLKRDKHGRFVKS